MSDQEFSCAGLEESIKQFFKTWKVEAEVAFDYPQRFRQNNQGPGGGNRVVIVYGDEGGNCGTFDAAIDPGEHTRTTPGNTTRRLLTDGALFTFWIWGTDPANRESRAHQIDASRRLRDWTIRAIVAFGHADVTYGNTNRSESLERQFGQELVIDVVIRLPVDDAPLQVVMAGQSRLTLTVNPP
jgi:hypothetical protein